MAEVKAGDLTESNGPVFDARVGADPMEEEESLDLNFMEEETVAEVEEEAAAEVEETVAEVEEVEAEVETEEAVAEVEEKTVAEEVEVELEDLEEVEAKVEPQPKKHMVPKERLDAVLAKQKALQKQLEDLQAQNTPDENAPEAYDYDTKEAEYQEFILDGETAKATALRKEMRAAEKAELQYEFDQKWDRLYNKANKRLYYNRQLVS